MNRAPFGVGEFYHLYNRGTEKRAIFMDEYDYRRFVTLLYLCNSKLTVNIEQEIKNGTTFSELMRIDRGACIVNIGAYCLMPNHFHLLVREKEEGGTSLFMKKLSTAYTMYFNSKYSRNGALFQGRYKSKHADDDEYLKYLFAYIHLNPVKIIDPLWKENGITDRTTAERYLEQYTYSSYHDYMGKEREESPIITPSAFPEYFTETQTFEEFVDYWLSSETQ